MTSAKLSALDLGYSSAEADAHRQPAFLRDAFVDPGGLVEACTFGTTTVVLGSKGTGKSALGRHLTLTKAVGATQIAPQMYELKDLVPPPTPGAPVAFAEWRMLLLSMLLGGILRDRDSWLPKEHRKRVDALLDAYGLPLLASAKTGSFEAAVALKAPFLSLDVKKAGDEALPQKADLINALKAAARAAESPKKVHMVIIDGVDELLMWGDVGLASAASLIDDLKWLSGEDLGGHRLLLLCSQDVFDRAASKNKNKVLQDNAQTLSWYASGERPGQLLLDLVDRRARTCGTTWEAVKEASFPSVTAPGLGDRSVDDLLLRHTRYNPRDLLMMLKKIGDHSRRVDEVTWETIAQGIQDYASRYFLHELQDELTGYLSPGRSKRLFNVMTADGRVEIDKAKFAHAEADFERTEIDTFLARLFECGALGGVGSSTSRRQVHHYVFADGDVAIEGYPKLVMHPALQVGLRIRQVE